MTSDDTMFRVERNDKWTVKSARHLTLESVVSVSDNAVTGLPAVAA